MENLLNLSEEEENLYWENLKEELKCKNYNKTKKIIDRIDVVLPEGLTKIPCKFFDYMPIDSVVIAKSIKEISQYAFYRCRDLKEIQLHEGITSIGEGAFAVSGLETIEIPKSIKRIGKSWFYRCRNLKTIKMHDTINSIGESAFEGAGIETIEFPRQLSRIGPNAFRGTDLKKVVLPPKIKYINRETFSCCGMLEEVVLPKNLIEIRENAFERCRKLKKINLNSVKPKLSFCVFDYCESLSEDDEFVVVNGKLYRNDAIFKTKPIIIPDCVKIVGFNCFSFDNEEDELHQVSSGNYFSSNFCTKIIVPSSVTEIEDNSFAGSPHLKEIVFNCKIPEIPGWAFYFSKKLKKITIHKDTKIDKRAYDAYQTLKDRGIEVVYWE